jgi:hypothetical protein
MIVWKLGILFFHCRVAKTSIVAFVVQNVTLTGSQSHFFMILSNGAIRARLLSPTRYGTFPLLTGEWLLVAVFGNFSGVRDASAGVVLDGGVEAGGSVTCGIVALVGLVVSLGIGVSAQGVTLGCVCWRTGLFWGASSSLSWTTSLDIEGIASFRGRPRPRFFSFVGVGKVAACSTVGSG